MRAASDCASRTSARVVVELERLIQRKTGDTNARISEYFDLITGNSGGAFLCQRCGESIWFHPRVQLAGENSIVFGWNGVANLIH